MPPRRTKLPGRDFDVTVKPTRKPPKSHFVLPAEELDAMVKADSRMLPTLASPAPMEVLPPLTDYQFDLESTELRTGAQFSEAITALWRQAERSYIDIGRLLLRAKDIIPHGEFMSLVKSQVPFDYSVTGRLMRAAEFVLSGAVSVERLPPGYSVVAEIAALPAPLLKSALEEGVVNPNARKADIIRFRKTRDSRSQDDGNRVAVLQGRKRRLERMLDAVNEALRQLGA